MGIDSRAWWYVDGRWVHPQEATISVMDVAVLRGYCVFESLRTYHRRPFYLDEHLNRLYRSAEIIDLHIPYTREFIEEKIQEAIVRNAYKHASIRIFVTGGSSEDGVTPSGKPVLMVLISPLGERDMERFARGIKVITTPHLRGTPEAKSTDYVAAMRALREAERRGASDALYVNERNEVLEGTRSNFFIFRDKTLITPKEGILKGVTRNVVLALARDLYQVEERPIRLEELSTATEAFITGSSREITPVVQIDDMPIGNGKPGPRTYELELRFIELVERA